MHTSRSIPVHTQVIVDSWGLCHCGHPNSDLNPSEVFAQVRLLVEVVVILGIPGIDCVLYAMCSLCDGCSNITVLQI